MKTLTTLIFLLVATLISAQNWDLFPLNQGTYRSADERTPEGYEAIRYISADSFRTEMQTKIWYLNSKYLPDSLLKCIKPKPLDSLLLRNDTLFYHDFYFLPKAKPGDSWYFPYNYKEWFDSIKITYDKIEQREFLGTTDSVKLYSFEGFKDGVKSNNLNEKAMQLSKHFGLIEHVPLKRLVYRYNAPSFYSSTILGIENDTMQIGYKPQKFEEFLPQFNAGDILFWQKYIDPHGSPETYYNRDSITKVIENSDSIYYTYNRTTFNQVNEITEELYNLFEKFTPENYTNIINAKPGLSGFGWADSSATLNLADFFWGQTDSLSFPKNEHTHYLRHDIIHWHNFEDEHTFVRANSDFIYDNIVYLDSCISQKFYDLNGFSLATGKGRVAAWVNDGQRSVSEFLIGSIINGIDEGILEVPEMLEIPEDTLEVMPSATESLLQQPTISLYPNPVNDFIYIKYDKNKLQNAHYQIVDINGRLVLEGKLHSDEITVNDLTSGIYFLKLKLDKKFLVRKFIK